MSKFQKGTLIRTDATVATGVKLFRRTRFPLADVIRHETKFFKDIAIPNTIQIDTCIEISKKDYEAFNKLHTSQREPNDNKKEEKP